MLLDTIEAGAAGAAKKLEDLGFDPIVALPICAQALGVSMQTLKNIARRGKEIEIDGKRYPELQIIRVSERRCGIRRSVLDRFIESRKSAVAVTGKSSAPRRLGVMAKRKPEIAEAEIADGV
jgi:hypothetical protein